MSLIDELVVVDELGDHPIPRTRRFRRAAVPRAFGRRAALGLSEGRESQEVRHREISYRRILALADVIAVAAAVVGLVALFPKAVFNPAMLVGLPFVVIVAKVFGIYERDELVIKKTTLDEAPVLMQIAGLITLIVWVTHDRLGVSSLEGVEVVWTWATMFCALFVARASARRLAAAISSVERCLVVGDLGAIETVARKLSTSRVNARVIAGLPVSERQPTLEEEAFRDMVRHHAIERVIIAPVSTDAADTLELIRLVKGVGVRVSLLPRLLEVVGSSVEFDNVGG